MPVCVDPSTREAYFVVGVEKMRRKEAVSDSEYFTGVGESLNVRNVLCHFHGWIDKGETIQVGASRECWEESRGVGICTVQIKLLLLLLLLLLSLL